MAIISNDVQKVEHLLAAGLNPNSVVGHDYRDLSMLYLAALHGRPEILKILLGHGADIQVGGNNVATPLHAAAGAHIENLEVVKVLVANGADLNARNSRGQTAYDIAVLKGYTMITKYLLDCGADPNIRACRHELTYSPSILMLWLGTRVFKDGGKSHGRKDAASSRYFRSRLGIA